MIRKILRKLIAVLSYMFRKILTKLIVVLIYVYLKEDIKQEPISMYNIYIPYGKKRIGFDIHPVKWTSCQENNETEEGKQ